jgi:Xaa-Pro dipeptidase
MQIRVPEKEIQNRIERLKKHLRAHGIDCALIQQNVDKFYFTGTFQDGVLLLTGDGDVALFIRRSLERARKESPLHCIHGYKSIREIYEYLRDRGFKTGTLGLEMDVLPSGIFQRIKSIFSNSSFTDLSEPIREIRAIKSSFELAKLAEAGKRLDRILERVREVIKPGVTEYTVYRVFSSDLLEEGSCPIVRSRRFNMESLSCYVLSGSSASRHSMIDSPSSGGEGVTIAYPAGAGHKRLRTGEPILIDAVFNFDGYHIDCTRIFAIGRIDRGFLHAHGVSQQCHEIFINAVQQHRTISQIHRDIVEAVRKERLEAAFMGGVKFIGHGVGLELDELPIISERYNGYIEEGMAVAFEPKFVFENGTVGYETSYHIKGSTCVALNNFPSDINTV